MQSYQNMDYMEQYNPDYVLILSGDHIYKMDYEVMLDFHKANKADVTIACYAGTYGRGKPISGSWSLMRQAVLQSLRRSRSIQAAIWPLWAFTYSAGRPLRKLFITLKDQQSCDFGKHILPYCQEKGERLFAYEYNGYWKDVGTLGSYWEANMELIDIIPEFNLYEEFWKIYTKERYYPTGSIFPRTLFLTGV